jgi:hypothetical protein
MGSLLQSHRESSGTGQYSVDSDSKPCGCLASPALMRCQTCALRGDIFATAHQSSADGWRTQYRRTTPLQLRAHVQSNRAFQRFSPSTLHCGDRQPNPGWPFVLRQNAYLAAARHSGFTPRTGHAVSVRSVVCISSADLLFDLHERFRARRPTSAMLCQNRTRMCIYLKQFVALPAVNAWDPYGQTQVCTVHTADRGRVQQCSKFQ